MLTKTNITVEDMKKIVNDVFNGNLDSYRLSGGIIDYKNDNSEEITIKNLDYGTVETKDLAQYLNVEFYSWRNRLVSSAGGSFVGYEEWLESLNVSMDKSYGLVEFVNDVQTISSPDIDFAVKAGKITFLIQSSKIKNLEYYISKLRGKYLGVPEKYLNANGDMLTMFLMFGVLTLEEAPAMTNLGECIVASCGFKITYISEAATYSDTKFEISLDGDDLYSESGEIVDENGSATTTKYLTMPITKITQKVFTTSDSVPTASRPDITGFVAKSTSCTKTISFYDFNNVLAKRFNELFWGMCAVRKDGKVLPTQDVNIPVYIRVTSDGHTYVYKDMINSMEKVVSNNDFNISSITLNGWGKITG